MTIASSPMRLCRLRPPRPPRRRVRRGAILVGVLWLTLLLSALAVTLRIHMSSVAQSVRMTEDRAAARAIADAGLAAAAARIRAALADTTEPVPDQLGDAIELASGRVDVTMVNEALRVDLNRAELPLIAGLLDAAGATSGQARDLADDIVALRSTSEGEEGAAPVDPQSAFTPFQSVDELAALLGIPSPLAISAVARATVSSGLSGIRLDAADPAMLDAIPGLPTAIVSAIEGWRAGRLTRAQLDEALSDVELHTAEKSEVWRTTLQISLDSGHLESQEALLLILEGDSVGYRVLDWRRPADGPE